MRFPALRAFMAAMSDDVHVLEAVTAAFAPCERPAHFTNYMHCCECADHDAVLLARDNDTLGLDDVGNPGWDPLCYVDPTGFAYYFPALARLALTEPGAARDWYVPQLLFHLTYDRESNRHRAAFSAEQRHAVVTLLAHIAETRAGLVAQWMCVDDLRDARALWEAPPGRP